MIEDLVEQFTSLEDPRCPSKIEHRLVDILVIAVCAIVAEAETFEDIAQGGCSWRSAPPGPAAPFLAKVIARSGRGWA